MLALQACAIGGLRMPILEPGQLLRPRLLERLRWTAFGLIGSVLLVPRLGRLPCLVVLLDVLQSPALHRHKVTTHRPAGSVVP
jgi:hypothetical protein